VCTTELSNTRDDLSLYEGLKTQVLAISVDSVFTLAKYKEEQKFNFPILSDFNKKVSAAYDTLYDEFFFGMHGVSKRSAFIIDKKGIIRYAEVLEDAMHLPDFEAIRETLTALQKEETMT
jgi:peroxiredoxin